MQKHCRRKQIFKGKRINVYTSIRTLPNKQKAYLEEVDHPGASLVVPFIKDKIVFIRQYRGVIGKYIWELPAGVLDEGETPYLCAKREVTEETGYVIKNLKKIGYIYTTPGFSNEKIHIFKALCTSKQKTQMDPDEIIKTKLLSKKEVVNLFKSGKISDAKTIAALSFAGII